MKRAKNISGIIFFAIALMFIINGCSKSDSNPASSDDGSSGGGSGSNQIAITVGSGTQPTYTWSGGKVFSVSVVRTSDPNTVIWGIASPGVDGIDSPVTHGSGANMTTIFETAATEKTLTAGVSYRVTVSRTDKTTGWKDFTP